MAKWQQHPKIYEINTRVWLNTLSEKYNEDIQLGNVPDEVIDELAGYHCDAIWLMGIWHRGPATRASALNYLHEYRGALPDITQDDVVGSAYAIHDYQVDPAMGGRRGLARLRKQLHKRGLKLILDFVPNHVAVDHRWIAERPDYFVLASAKELKQDSDNFFPAKDAYGKNLVVAHGRDPYFPGWIDTAQLNAFSPAYREAAINVLKDIGKQADGVRCDMAMLMMNDIFSSTWGWLGVEPLEEDFWSYVIPKVRAARRDFLFIAETYWGLDFALHLEGFDYTYDKTMYDRLISNDVPGIYAHLQADIEFLKKNIRFIENHDEPRAMTTFGLERSRPAAALICTLPGAVLLHDGQFTGRKIKLPVQIKRQPHEREHPELKQFYMQLLSETSDEIYQKGDWFLFPVTEACEGCNEHAAIVAHGWRYEGSYRLIVLNMSGEWSQGRVQLEPWASAFGDKYWQMLDVMQQTYHSEAGADIVENGLPVDLEPYSVRIFNLLPDKRRSRRRVRSAST